MSADRKVLAIVGSRHFADPTAIDRARKIIVARLRLLPPTALVISGGADGVDTWAAEEASHRGFEVEVFLPENPRWEPDGYKARNKLMADRCDELLCIRCADAKSYGSGWTADQAAIKGKRVVRHYLAEAGDWKVP